MYISGLRKVFVNSHFCNLFGYQIKKKIQKTKNKNRNKKMKPNNKKKIIIHTSSFQNLSVYMSHMTRFRLSDVVNIKYLWSFGVGEIQKD